MTHVDRANSVVTPSAVGMVTPVVCESREAIAAIEADWLRLIEQTPDAQPGVEPQRFLETLQAMRGDTSPFIVLFRRSDEPCGMIIGRRDRSSIPCRTGYFKWKTPRLRILRIAYGGALSDGRPDTDAAIVRFLNDQISGGGFDSVFTNKLSLENPILSQLMSGGRAVQREVRPHWVTDLTPYSYDDSISHHSSKHRSNLRRLDRKLCEAFNGEVELDITTTVDQAARFAQAMRRIFDQTYKAGIAANQMEGLDWMQALQSRAKLGELRSYLLIAGGEPIAYQTGTLHRGVYYAEGTAYLPAHQALRPGTVLMMRVMQDLCAQGAHVIDWGFGDAEYKRLYGTRFWNEAAAHVYSRTPRAIIAKLIDRTAVALSTKFKSAAGDSMTSRIRRGWKRKAGRGAASDGAGAS